MSTKIYTGIKFNGDFFEVHKELDKMSLRVRERTTELYHEMVAAHLYSTLDKLLWSGEEYDVDTELRKSYRHVSNEIRNAIEGKVRNPYYDISFKVMIIPHEGKLYGVHFIDNRKLTNIIKTTPMISDFSYWDNSDPDEDVSDEDWEERSRVWNDVFSGSISTFKEVGYERDLTFSELYLIDFNTGNVLKPQSIEKRAKVLAESLGYTNYDQSKFEEGVDITSFFEYRGTEAYKKDYDDAYEKLINMLPEKYEIKKEG